MEAKLITPTSSPEPGAGATATWMHREAAEAGAAVARFMAHNAQALADLGARLRQAPPSLVLTCARGSSDHAATYAKYMIETLLGVPTASAAFSTVSLYDAPMRAATGNAPLCIAISQSGHSPDMLATVERYQAAGALVVALVNNDQSPLAQMADVALPLCAGPEISVAATKSFITSLAGIAALVAAWSQDEALNAALAALPAALDESFALGWDVARAGLQDATNLFLISRGYGLSIAQEAALKLKETSGLHGEAFSSAEVRHGPMAIVRDGFPVLGFDIGGQAGADVRQVCADFAERGAQVFLATPEPEAVPAGPNLTVLPAVAADEAIAPLLRIASFYRMVNALSISRGFNPDEPPFLAKVTRTR